MTEKEKMELGLWYDAGNDKDLVKQRVHAKSACYRFNQTDPIDKKVRLSILEELFGYQVEGLEIVQPFLCDYGRNITLGKEIFINSNCYFMDCANITIKDHVFMGPSCGLYTASHPLGVEYRNMGLEKATPIVIEENVWLGGNVVVLPGVTIGANSVIGAGSIVTKDIPSGVIALGNPCKVIREITEDDKIVYK